jgi:hypothetical protein
LQGLSDLRGHLLKVGITLPEPLKHLIHLHLHSLVKQSEATLTFCSQFYLTL